MKRSLHIAAALWLTVLVGCSNGSSAGSANLRRISLEEAHDMVANPSSDLIILDVRTPDEIAESRIAEDIVTADFLGPDFRATLETLDKDAPYLMYCRSGNRSSQALKIMEDMGFSDVAEVEGGIIGWVASGYQTHP